MEQACWGKGGVILRKATICKDGHVVKITGLEKGALSSAFGLGRLLTPAFLSWGPFVNGKADGLLYLPA